MKPWLDSSNTRGRERQGTKILVEHVVMTAPGPRITAADLLIPWGKIAEVECSEDFGQSLSAQEHVAEEPTGANSVIEVVTSTEAIPPEPRGQGPTRIRRPCGAKWSCTAKELHSGKQDGAEFRPCTSAGSCSAT